MTEGWLVRGGGEAPGSSSGLVAAARARLERLTSREAWLLVILGLNLAGGLAMLAGDWAHKQQDRYTLSASTVASQRQARANAAKGVLSDADREALAGIRARSLEARDVWMARLVVEQQLVRALTAAHVGSPEVKVAEALEGGSALPVLRAEAGGPWSGRALLTTLEQLGAEDPAPIVQGLKVTAGANPEFRLSLAYPVRTATAPAP